MPLIGCRSHPAHRLGFALLQPAACQQTKTQIVLGIRVTLISGEAIPANSFAKIYRNPLALLEDNSQVILSNRVSLISRELPPPNGLCFVRGNPASKCVGRTQQQLRFHVTLGAQLAQLFDSRLCSQTGECAPDEEYEGPTNESTSAGSHSLHLNRRLGSSPCQRLSQVCHQVLGIFDADGQAQQLPRQSRPLLNAGAMLDQTLDATQRGRLFE